MQEPDVPPFELPDWGTAGAPQAPDLGDEAVRGRVGAAGEERPPQRVLLSTILASSTGGDVLRMVTSEGVGDVERDGLAVATAAARDAALDRLTALAEDLGAGTVAGVRLAIVSRRKQVVVIAYGTALRSGL